MPRERHELRIGRLLSGGHQVKRPPTAHPTPAEKAAAVALGFDRAWPLIWGRRAASNCA